VGPPLYVLVGRIVIQVINLPRFLSDSIGSKYLIGSFVISSNINFVYQTLLIVIFIFALAEIFQKHNSYTVLICLLSFRVLERVAKFISVLVNDGAREVFYQYNKRMIYSFFQDNQFSENDGLLISLAGMAFGVVISLAIITYLYKIKDKKVIANGST